MRVCMSQRPSAPLCRTVTFKIPMVKHRLQGRGLITVAVSYIVYCKPFGTKIDSQIHIIKTVAVVTVKLQETDELQTTVVFFLQSSSSSSNQGTAAASSDVNVFCCRTVLHTRQRRVCSLPVLQMRTWLELPAVS